MPLLDKKNTKTTFNVLLGMRLVEMKLDEGEIAFGVDGISLVESPAIESNFVALKKEEVQALKFATVSDEKRIVMGALLIPEKPIFKDR